MLPMKPNDIASLAGGLGLLAQDQQAFAIETHISWVILAGAFAYKIKKPIRFSFLDFSTLNKRKYYCERELTLNQRLAPQMYLQVIPVVKQGRSFSLNAENGRIVDYTVQMKRMDTALEMDKLLMARAVSEEAIETLAAKIAGFHKRTPVITCDAGIDTLKKRFNDLQIVLPVVQQHLGNDFPAIIYNAIKKSNEFLDRHRHFIAGRAAEGWVRDGHGDLHSGNIFLYPDPVIFDCIEFNDGMRQIDILDEIAFLCMDLDAYGQEHLSENFYNAYLSNAEIKETEKVKMLFHYYKCYRANVRAKIHLFAATEANDQTVFAKKLHQAANYLSLLKKYLDKYSPEFIAIN